MGGKASENVAPTPFTARELQCGACENSTLFKSPPTALILHNHSQLTMPFASPHKCTTCSRTFARKNDLARHEQTAHNPNVPRVFCPYPEGIQFEFSSSASSPIISWKRPNPDHCPCRFSAKVGQETNLTTHILKHLGYRWSCPVCNKSFADRASISRHKHKWSASFRAEQQRVQRVFLMRGDNWLRETSRSLATGVWGVLGTAFSWLGGVREPAREEETPPRNRRRSRARYRPYATRARSLAPPPSPSQSSSAPSASAFDTPSPHLSPQSSSFETLSLQSRFFQSPPPQWSFIDSPTPLPPLPPFELDLIPEEPMAYTPPTSPPTSPPCDWESSIDPRLL